MLREEVLQSWHSCQEKISQLKTKSIDNYPKVKKITLLSLDSIPLRTDNWQPAQGILYDLVTTNGSVTKKPTKLHGTQGVDLLVEVLEVAILQDLSTDENISLSNYAELTLANGPVLEEVD